jgi:hypothetical protein
MLKLIAAVAYIAIGIIFGWGAALALLAAHVVLACLVVVFGGSK